MINDKVAFANQIAELLNTSSDLVQDLANQQPRNQGDISRLLRYQSIRQYIPVKSLRRLFLIPRGATNTFDKCLRRGGKTNLTIREPFISSIKQLYGPGNNFLEKQFNLCLDKWDYPRITS